MKSLRHPIILLCLLWIFVTCLSPVLARQCETGTITRQNNMCPQGYEVCQSDKGDDVCQICPKGFYQPGWNYGNKLCAKKATCNGSLMYEDQPGSNIENAQCKCHPGYHFPKLVPEVCLENEVCPPGQGQSAEGDGTCVPCPPGTYSNLNNREQNCLVAAVCENHRQCTLTESTPASNTKCSLDTVTDISQCAILYPRNVTTVTRSDNSTQATSISSTEQSDVNPNYLGIAIGTSVGVLIIIIIILAKLLVARCRKRTVDSGYENPNIPLDTSPDIVDTSCSVDVVGVEVTNAQIVALARGLGNDWLMLSGVLGYPNQSDKERFATTNNSTNRPDISAYNMLSQWKEDNNGDATVEKLIGGLKAAQISVNVYIDIFQIVLEQTIPKTITES